MLSRHKSKNLILILNLLKNFNRINSNFAFKHIIFKVIERVTIKCRKQKFRYFSKKITEISVPVNWNKKV